MVNEPELDWSEQTFEFIMGNARSVTLLHKIYVLTTYHSHPPYQAHGV
ncbi:hypothetical protein ES702_05196 [subsurface metagenome]